MSLPLFSHEVAIINLKRTRISPGAKIIFEFFFQFFLKFSENFEKYIHRKKNPIRIIKIF